MRPVQARDVNDSARRSDEGERCRPEYDRRRAKIDTPRALFDLERFHRPQEARVVYENPKRPQPNLTMNSWTISSSDVEDYLPPAPMDQLLAFEMGIGHSLNEDYRQFLIRCNGGQYFGNYAFFNCWAGARMAGWTARQAVHAVTAEPWNTLTFPGFTY